EDGIRDFHVTGVRTCALPIFGLPRLFFAMLILTFTVYMVPGMWGAPLKGISAWLPHQSTQDFDLNKLSYASPAESSDQPQRKYEIGRASCRERVQSWEIEVRV